MNLRLAAAALGFVLTSCLSTESGNPETASSSDSPGPMGTSLPSAPPAAVPSAPASFPTPPASVVPFPSPSASVPPSLPPTPSASGSSEPPSLPPPCEFSEFDAGARLGDADAPTLRVFRCGVLDGGVSCTCGEDPRSAVAPASTLLPAGEQCDVALLEQCGRQLR